MLGPFVISEVLTIANKQPRKGAGKEPKKYRFDTLSMLNLRMKSNIFNFKPTQGRGRGLARGIHPDRYGANGIKFA